MNGGNGAEVALQLSPSSNSYSIRGAHVSYSCGSCGYELNLDSCNRNISGIDAEYGKSMERGVISFFSIDESRFMQKDKVSWWRLFRRQTKLLCRSCGSSIGTASTESSPSLFRLVKQTSAAWDGISGRKMYEIKIRSLRPLSIHS